MSFFSHLKKAVGIAAMTNPVTALAWKGYQSADKPSPKAAPPQDIATMPVSDEQVAAVSAGGPEAEAYLRGLSRIDDDDLMKPTYKTPPRRGRSSDDLAKPNWNKESKNPRRAGGSDDLMGFACSVLGVEAPVAASAPSAPPDMNNLASDSTITNDVFRALVWRNAKKVSGGRRPDAKTIASVQSAVLQFLKLKNIKIALPGAKPGRRTV
jgi:hypothetical protein